MTLPIPDRLRAHRARWEEIGASPDLLRQLQDGVLFPFRTEPPPRSFRNSRRAWSLAVTALSLEAISDLHFWSRYPFPSVPLQPLRACLNVVTDASETHCGGFIHARGINRTCTIPLPPTARGESSTYRELVAIREVLTLWGETFSGRRICLKTDSSGWSFQQWTVFITPLALLCPLKEESTETAEPFPSPQDSGWSKESRQGVTADLFHEETQATGPGWQSLQAQQKIHYYCVLKRSF